MPATTGELVKKIRHEHRNCRASFCDAIPLIAHIDELTKERDDLREKVRELEASKCQCCGKTATQFLDSETHMTCDFCAEHCRAPGPIDTNWYHGTIA